MQTVRVRSNALVSERNYLPEHDSRKIGSRAQSRVTHDVEIRESGQPQSIADAVATRAFCIEENFGRLRQLVAEIQRVDFEVAFSPYECRLFFPLYCAGNVGCHCRMMFACPEIQ